MMESLIFLDLSLGAWLTIGLVITMFGLMMFTKIPAEFVFIGGMEFLCKWTLLSIKEECLYEKRLHIMSCIKRNVEPFFVLALFIAGIS